MAEQPKAASLEDIISYTPETYFSEPELTLLRSHFNGSTGVALLKVVRKAMIPTVSDPDLPLEELGKDMFMAHLDFSKMPSEEVKAAAMGMQLAAKVIVGSLIQLRSLANVKEESIGEVAERIRKNSSK